MADVSIEITRENYELVGDDTVALTVSNLATGFIQHPTHATKALGEKFALLTVDDITIDERGRTLGKNKDFRAALEQLFNVPSVAANLCCVKIYCPDQ